MICTDCGAKPAETGEDICFRCRVSTVGLAFVGGGGRTRSSFADRTNTEWMNENLGFDHPERIRSGELAPIKEFGR